MVMKHDETVLHIDRYWDLVTCEACGMETGREGGEDERMTCPECEREIVEIAWTYGGKGGYGYNS